MAEHNPLYGSCACERNQYTVTVPAASTSQVQVFFDNSAVNRRSQAAPLTAWLRVPLEWYHSTTYALFPDETHASIKRTYNTPNAARRQASTYRAVTRRQFCGYCGTHLTAWEEGGNEGYMDVTLGSLAADSLEVLESLGVLDDEDSEEEEVDEEVDRSEGGREVTMGGVEGAVGRRESAHTMQDRGMPYFESMVQDSRLGRIKRQKGGHTSRDGRTTVQWEIVEIGDEDEGGEQRTESNKRVKLDA